jgi:hypothetical protein
MGRNACSGAWIWLLAPSHSCRTGRRYVILPKDIEKGYKANVKKGDTEFAFYQ